MAKQSVLILIACSALAFMALDDYKDGMKAYENGNKIDALQFFIVKVTDDPKHQKSVDMIKKLLPEVIELRKANAKRFEKTGQWEKAQKEYDRLRRLDKVLQSLIVYDNKKRLQFPRIDVAEAQAEATDNAAERYYLQGVEAMKTIGKADEAVKFLKEARKFDPDYKDAKELSAQALYNDGIAHINEGNFKAAVSTLWQIRDFYPDGFMDSEEQIAAAIDSAKVKVAVMPFDDLTFRMKYGDVGSNLSSQVIAAGVSREPIFVDFVSRDYVNALLAEQNFGSSGRVDPSTAPALGKLIGIHVFVFGKVTTINPNYPRVLKVDGKVSGTIYRGGEERFVAATWSKYTRTGKVTVSANYQIVDVKTGRILDSNSLSRTSSSTAQWVSYWGDEEALRLDTSIKAHNTTGDMSVDPPEILASYALNQISNAIATSVLKYYEEF